MGRVPAKGWLRVAASLVGLALAIFANSLGLIIAILLALTCLALFGEHLPINALPRTGLGAMAPATGKVIVMTAYPTKRSRLGLLKCSLGRNER